MSTLKTRPARLEWSAYPGQERTVVLTGWPANHIDSKTYVLTIEGGTSVTGINDTGAETVAFPLTVPTAKGTKQLKIAQDGDVIVRATIKISDTGDDTFTGDLEVTVNDGTVTFDLTVQVLGAFGSVVVAQEQPTSLGTWGLFIPFDETPPAAPADFVAAPSHLKVTLSWARNSEPDLGSFQVRKDDDEWIDVGTAETYQYTGLTDGVDYDFFVRAVDLFGNIGEPATAGASPAPAAIVQYKAATPVTDTSITVTLDADPTPGNVLVWFFALSGDKSEIESPGAHTVDVVSTATDSSALKAWTYTVREGDGAVYTFLQNGAAVDLDAVVVELSGINTDDPVNGEVTDKENTGATSLALGPLVTTENGLRALFMWRTEHDAPVFSGATNVDSILLNTGRILVATELVTTAGSFNTTASWGSSTKAVALGVAFQ